jgi:DNA-binding LacI/PurR family transcriptional regulator
MSAKPVQTLEDIARLAHVSRSTVSRALSDSPLLSQKTKERIQAIAREHHFRINASARNLRLRNSRTVAFVAPMYSPSFLSTEDVFGLEMLGGIGSGLRVLGYDCLIIQSDPHDATWAHDYLDSGRVDGFILLASNLKPSHIQTLVEKEAPFIVWGAPVAPFDYCTVTGDNSAGGRQATEHLIRTGRQQIAFLGGPEASVTIRKRFNGYAQTLQDAGRNVDPALVVYGDYSYASGIAATQRLIDQSPDLDAVFVTSDLMAVGAINAIQASGRRVPEDIAVVGYDDLSIASYTTLPLTTIRQNIPLAGKLLAQNLIQRIETGLVTHVTVPTELVIRKSA